MAFHSYKYKGKTPVKTGDWVVLTIGEDDEQVEAKVVDALASQFTAKVPYDKVVRFCSYKDKGLTWRHRT
jgi:hypothetical protein